MSIEKVTHPDTGEDVWEFRCEFYRRNVQPFLDSDGNEIVTYAQECGDFDTGELFLSGRHPRKKDAQERARQHQAEHDAIPFVRAKRHELDRALAAAENDDTTYNGDSPTTIRRELDEILEDARMVEMGAFEAQQRSK